MVEEGSEVDLRVFSVETCVFMEFDEKLSTLNRLLRFSKI